MSSPTIKSRSNPSLWTPEQVSHWFQQKKLGSYGEMALNLEIDGATLLNLAESKEEGLDLKTIFEIEEESALNHLKKLLLLLKAQQQAFEKSSSTKLPAPDVINVSSDIARGAINVADSDEPVMCIHHQSPLHSVCRQDKALLCTVCAHLEEHKGHTFITFQQAKVEANEEKERLLQKATLMMEKQKEVLMGASSSATLFDQSKTASRFLLNESFDRLSASLMDLKENFLRELDTYSTEAQKDFEPTFRHSRENLDGLQLIVDFLTKFSPLSETVRLVDVLHDLRYVEELFHSHPSVVFIPVPGEILCSLVESSIFETLPTMVRNAFSVSLHGFKGASTFEESSNTFDSEKVPTSEKRESEHLDDGEYLEIDSAPEDLSLPKVPSTPPKVCGGCLKSIPSEGKFIEALEMFFHPTCLKCSSSDCSETLHADTLFEHEGAVFCSKHFSAIKTPKTESKDDDNTCNVCKLPTTEATSSLHGKKNTRYHEVCFVCTICHGELDGPYYSIESEGALFCKSCNDKGFDKKCQRCKKCITFKDGNRQANAVGKLVYHSECLSCARCGTSLLKEDSCAVRNHDILCKKCL